MAGHNRYTALLDANVLYSVAISDALMEVAATGIYAAKWSKAIDDEWVRNLAKNKKEQRLTFIRDEIRCMTHALTGKCPKQAGNLLSLAYRFLI